MLNNELKERGVISEYIDLEKLYVMANDEVTVENNSQEITLLRASSIYPYIKRQPVNSAMTKEVQDAIADILSSKKKPIKKYPIMDYRKAFRYYVVELVGNIEECQQYTGVMTEYLEKIKEISPITSIRKRGKEYLAF